MWKIIEQHIPGAAAKNDSKRDPDNEVVEVDDLEWCWPAPKLFRCYNGARIKPAGDDADDVGQRIPPDSQRAEVDQHWVNCWKRQNRQDQHQTDFHARERWHR